jgi:LacI family transcriptional regulator
VLIAATRNGPGHDLALSVAGKVDGLVVMARSLPDRDLARISRSVPVVVLAAGSAPRRLDFVGADNRGGARAITAHLIEVHGYRDLAFIGGPAQSPDSIQRFIGFSEALRDAGLPVPEMPDAEGGFTEEGGERAMRAVLANRSRPRAVVIGNDEMAIGALAALRSLRLRVPSDIALTGFDDIAAARHVRPALTTVRQPMRDLGEQAVRALLDRLADPGAPRRTQILPTEAVIRRSCGCGRRTDRPVWGLS